MRVALQPPSRSTLSRPPPPRYFSPFRALPAASKFMWCRPGQAHQLLPATLQEKPVAHLHYRPCTLYSLLFNSKNLPRIPCPLSPFCSDEERWMAKGDGMHSRSGNHVNLNRREMRRVCKTTFCEICRAYSMILRFGDVFPHLSGEG